MVKKSLIACFFSRKDINLYLKIQVSPKPQTPSSPENEEKALRFHLLPPTDYRYPGLQVCLFTQSTLPGAAGAHRGLGSSGKQRLSLTEDANLPAGRVEEAAETSKGPGASALLAGPLDPLPTPTHRLLQEGRCSACRVGAADIAGVLAAATTGHYHTISPSATFTYCRVGKLSEVADLSSG